MNSAYKQFLQDALTDYCGSRGINLDDLIAQVEFRADYPVSVSDENGNERFIHEPGAYDYADAAGVYIVSSLDEQSLEYEGVDIDKLSKVSPDAVSDVLTDWCDQCSDSLTCCDEAIPWHGNLETACANAGIELNDVLEDD